MLISDLIEELQTVLADEGDIEVMHTLHGEDYDIDVVKVEQAINGNYVKLY